MVDTQKFIQYFRTKKITSFTYLNITQFLGALNDNIYKLLIAFFLIQQLGADRSYLIFSTTGAIFVLPFLLFSSNSGTLADRFSKRNIIVFTKILELLVMSMGLMAFAFESVAFSYVTLFMMATQSAIFGPSKYGIMPEIVEIEKIPRANGLLTSFTFLAIIIGTFLASFITDITDRNFILAALSCTLISLAGVMMSFGIEYTPPSGSIKRLDVRFLRDIYKTLKVSYHVPSLLPAILGSAFFLFLGAYVQLNIIPFAMEALGLTDVQGGYLFLLTALGIGTGAVLAGRISGKVVELGIVPTAACGITICLFLIDYYSSSLTIIIPLILITGILGGMYQIPLDSFIQIASPNESRGQVIAATNFLSFSGVLLASMMLYLLSGVIGLRADQGFSVLGVFAGCVTIYFSFQFYDYVSRFVGMILSKLHFSTTYEGLDNIPSEPALYVCQHTAWNDTLLMLGAQRLRMRFFIQNEQEHKGWMKRLYKFLRVVFIPEVETLSDNLESIHSIGKTLRRGISICIFVENMAIEDEINMILSSTAFCDVLKAHETKIIPVKIEKGAKEKSHRFLPMLMNRIHIPAYLTFYQPKEIA
ncbi:MAG: Lysophospholipid transporter LplT [Chlamydiae bacterium]|nr:Lysophospholipid transporter LplT [Chlamydiota bacterium]